MDPFIHIWDIDDGRAVQFTAIVIIGLLLTSWIHKTLRSWKKNEIKE